MEGSESRHEKKGAVELSITKDMSALKTPRLCRSQPREDLWWRLVLQAMEEVYRSPISWGWLLAALMMKGCHHHSNEQ